MDTTCTVLTPPGRGAVAVVEVAGADRESLVDGLLIAANRRRLREQPIDSIRFGRWGSETGEELVVVRRREVVEVHCHGGRAASAAIVASLVERGARELTTADRLVKIEPHAVRRAARQTLERATTERVALVLLDQWQGALERECESILARLREGEVDVAAQQLERLSATWQIGRWLTRPARIVLTGPPNVGKSSLVNRLIGYERAIVFDEPGTTRDVVTASTAIDGWPVVLSDTAGIREAEGELEQAGIALARDAVAAADVVIEVEEGDMLLQTPQGGNFQGPLRVANKIDRVTPSQREELALRRYLPTSATTGEGLDRLLQAIAARLAPVALAAGEAVLFRQEEVEPVAEVLRAIRAGHVMQAVERLVTFVDECGGHRAFDRKSDGRV